MSYVKEINIKIIDFESSETCLNFCNCYSIEILTLDLSINSLIKFHIIISNYFNDKSDGHYMSFPKLFKE